jgi:transposase
MTNAGWNRRYVIRGAACTMLLFHTEAPLARTAAGQDSASAGPQVTSDEDVMALHRARLLLRRQRTQLSNAIRRHMREFGFATPAGWLGPHRLISTIADTGDRRIPEADRGRLMTLVARLRLINRQILENHRRIAAAARRTEVGRRLMEVPGIGPVLASALVAAIPDPQSFRSARGLAAWIGLAPRQRSKGGGERLGSITKQRDRYLRDLFVAGAVVAIRHADGHGLRRPWLIKVLERRPPRVAAVALANKTARVAWAIMTSGQHYRGALSTNGPVVS